MTELERKIKAKIPGPDTGIEVRHTLCDICSPGMHCGINAVSYTHLTLPTKLEV